jgi:hypothetical protein
VSMGIITAATTTPETAPPIPAALAGTWSKFRDLKFMQRDTGDKIILYPRAPLTWPDLTAYVSATQNPISIFETDIIMTLDAMYEGRADD